MEYDGHAALTTCAHGVKSESWLSRGFGERGASRHNMPALANWAVEDTLTEQVKVGATVHLPLEQFEARDVPFGLALTPR